MDDLNLDLPERFDAADVGLLISEYAPELEPRPPGLFSTWLSWLVGTVVMGAMSVGPAVTEGRGWLAAVFVISVIGSWVTRRGMLAGRRERYQRTIEERPYELHEKLALKFRSEIDAHRQRLLGDDTEWQNARAALRSATEEAKTSLDYWSDRSLEDPKSELALSHCRTAQRLHSKLADALTELDKRERALLNFFSECERKLKILDRSRSDHAESRRLAQLAQHTDDLVIDATLAIEAIGQHFIDEATRVGRVLGALERLQLKESAGDIEHEGVERVADRILQAAEEEERALSELVATVAE